MNYRLPDQSAKLGRLVDRLTDYFCLPEDSPDTRLRKALLVLLSVMFTLAGVVWAAIYILFGEVTAGMTPLAYGFVSLLSIAYFRFTRNFEIYRFSQLLLILLLPAFVMAALGGFQSGSAVILWAVASPLGALLFAPPKRAPYWLIAYLTILVIMAFIEPLLPNSTRLPEWLVTALFVLNIGVLTIVVHLLLNHFISQRNRTRDLLEQEREKSERLLLNVLPEEIAPQLKENETVAERFESASVLFADLVGFTQLSTQMSAERVVELLNEIVSHFDSLADAHGAEKIRTVGDNYLVATGVPVRRPDHAEALADLALEMRDYLRVRNQDTENPVQVRMGMATGSMIGAVIGASKFHYDVWGNAVNLASRLESSGVAGRIQIDAETQRRLAGEFECSYRGEIELKGMGTVQAWFLEGRAPDSTG